MRTSCAVWLHDPAPDEIAARAADIRATWSKTTRANRRADPDAVALRVFAVSHVAGHLVARPVVPAAGRSVDWFAADQDD